MWYAVLLAMLLPGCMKANPDYAPAGSPCSMGECMAGLVCERGICMEAEEKEAADEGTENVADSGEPDGGQEADGETDASSRAPGDGGDFDSRPDPAADTGSAYSLVCDGRCECQDGRRGANRYDIEGNYIGCYCDCDLSVP